MAFGVITGNRRSLRASPAFPAKSCHKAAFEYHQPAFYGNLLRFQLQLYISFRALARDFRHGLWPCHAFRPPQSWEVSLSRKTEISATVLPDSFFQFVHLLAELFDLARRAMPRPLWPASSKRRICFNTLSTSDQC